MSIFSDSFPARLSLMNYYSKCSHKVTKMSLSTSHGFLPISVNDLSLTKVVSESRVDLSAESELSYYDVDEDMYFIILLFIRYTLDRKCYTNSEDFNIRFDRKNIFSNELDFYIRTLFSNLVKQDISVPSLTTYLNPKRRARFSIIIEAFTYPFNSHKKVILLNLIKHLEHDDNLVLIVCTKDVIGDIYGNLDLYSLEKLKALSTYPYINTKNEVIAFTNVDVGLNNELSNSASIEGRCSWVTNRISTKVDSELKSCFSCYLRRIVFGVDKITYHR